MIQVFFKSIKNVLYRLDLYNDSEDYVELRASTMPFYTEVNNSDDFFFPVREQTGNIGIKGEVSDIENLLASYPANRPFTLWAIKTIGGITYQNVAWKGYLQTQAFTQRWDKGPNDISLPIISHLGIIASYNYEEAGYVRFAEFFKALNECTGTAFYSHFVFPNIANIATILKYHFSGQAFATWDPNKLTYQYTDYKHILEEICKLFGWTAIEYGDYLCFIEPDSSAGHVVFSAADITTLAGGGTASGTAIAQNTLVDDIDGADHTIDYLPGKKSVKVSGTPGNSFGDLFKFDVKNYQIRSTEDHNRPHESGSSEYDHYFTKNYGDSEEIEVSYNGNIRYENFYYDDEEHLYGSSCVTERQLTTDNTATPSPVVSDFGWISHIVCHSAPSGTNNIFSVHPARKHYASGLMGDMYIKIKFSVKQSKGFDQEWENYTGEIGMKVLLDETVLMDARVWCEDGSPYYYQSGYANADSCVAIIPGNATGNLHIQFNIPVHLIIDMYYSIQDLEVTYANDWRRHINDPMDENVSEFAINNGFTDTLDQKNTLTTQRPEFASQATSEQIGWGLVLDDDLDAIMKLYGNYYPEEALANRMYAHYQASKKLITAQLESSDAGMLNPLHLHIPGTGTAMVCLSQSVDWYNERVTAYLFEI